MIKPLSLMTEEVVASNRAKGWHDSPSQFSEAMAMLHSEVSEALEAWRVWGLKDNTEPGWISKNGALPKPEGVGSEFADIFIRLLDDAYLYGCLDLEKALKRAGAFALYTSFPANMNGLHDLISLASMQVGDGPPEFSEQPLGSVLQFLLQLCGLYGVDLETEYERKMAFNRTRPYRHGNKAI
jgi:NTP pyrophosphatase (non-canonical NTP hydrolase)